MWLKGFSRGLIAATAAAMTEILSLLVFWPFNAYHKILMINLRI